MIRLTVLIAALTVAMLASACAAPPKAAPSTQAAPPQPARAQQSAPESELSQLRLTEMCASAARQVWKDGGYDKPLPPGQVWNYYSHYNHRLHRCLIKTFLTTREKGTPVQIDEFISDAFEGIDVGSASNIERADRTVFGDDVLDGTSSPIEHTREWFKRLMAE